MTISVVSLEIFEKKKCLLSSPQCFIRLLSKSLNLIGCLCDIQGKFSKKYSKFFFSETIRRTKLKLSALTYGITLYRYGLYFINFQKNWVGLVG